MLKFANGVTWPAVLSDGDGTDDRATWTKNGTDIATLADGDVSLVVDGVTWWKGSGYGV